MSCMNFPTCHVPAIIRIHIYITLEDKNLQEQKLAQQLQKIGEKQKKQITFSPMDS